MKAPLRRAAALSLILAAAAAAPAWAHPKLVASTPADGETVAATDRVELRFSEALEASFSGAELEQTSMMMGGKMMNHTMKVGTAAVAVDAADPTLLVLTARKPLTAGGYKLRWHAVAADTHRVEGVVAFTVK